MIERITNFAHFSLLVFLSSLVVLFGSFDEFDSSSPIFLAEIPSFSAEEATPTSSSWP